jgi:hypothetical protein
MTGQILPRTLKGLGQWSNRKTCHIYIKKKKLITLDPEETDLIITGQYLKIRMPQICMLLYVGPSF